MRMASNRTRILLLAAVVVGGVALLSSTFAFAHDVSSSNVLTSATLNGASGKVTVVGTFTPGTETGIPPDGGTQDCGPATGRTVSVTATLTTSPFTVVSLGSGTTTTGGAYSFTPGTKLTVLGTYNIQTTVQGQIGGAYGATHTCLDAVSNTIPVTKT